jgi:predicted transcriptional regulator
MTPLKTYCDENGISSYKLAKMTGVSQPCAYRWMTGQTSPTLHHIAVITRATNGDVNALSFVPELADDQQPQ